MTASQVPLLIKNGQVMDPDGELDAPPVLDLFLREGLVVARGPAASEMAMSSGHHEVIDAAGMLVTPGFVNAHYHSHDVLLRGLFEQLPLDIWGLHSFPSYYPRRTAQEVALRTQLGAVECLRGGMTTVQDMVTVVGPDREHAQAIVSTYDDMGIRVCLALQVGDRPATDTMPFWRELLPADMAAGFSSAMPPDAMQAFIAGLLDSPPAGRLTWGLAPSSPERCSEGLLAWIRDLAAARDLRIFTHMYEARAQAVLARLRYQSDGGSFTRLLHRVGLLGPRLSIAHGIWITNEEIEEVAAAGASLVSNPMANLKLLDGIAPVQRYLDAGVNVGLGCDNCSCSDAQNMFQSMKTFAIFLGYQGRSGEQGAARQAFRAATLGSAKALGLEGKVGSLAIGSHADLVLIDTRDPVYQPMNSAVRQLVYAESGRAVHTVIVDGRILVRDRRMTEVDENVLAIQAAQAGITVREDYQAVAARHESLLAHLWQLRKRTEEYPLDIDRLRLK